MVATQMAQKEGRWAHTERALQGLGKQGQLGRERGLTVPWP